MNIRWRIRHWFLMLEAEYLAWKAAWDFVKREMWRR